MELSSFQNYREIEFSLINALTQLRGIAQQLDSSPQVAKIETIQTQITNHTFTLAVVGEFKRGKSTFINALLGKEILPADVVPTSATLNRVRYGLSPSVKVVMKATDDVPEHAVDIGIDELVNYVTKLTPEAESMATRVKEAVVYYPLPYCRNNVSIIDTPGLNDEAKMTAVTRSILPELDAALMVIMPDAPFAKTEGAFLRELLDGKVGRILFVVTAMDRVRRAADKERILEMIRTRITEAVHSYAESQYPPGSEGYNLCLQRLGTPRVYPISGYDALMAKKDKDETALEQSGFAEFERVLERFLTEERGAVTLRIIVEHILAITVNLLEILQKRKQDALHNQEALEARFVEAQAQLAQHREQNQSNLAQVDQAVARLQAQIEHHIGRAQSEMVLVAHAAIEQTEITSDDINKASWGVITSVVSARGRQFLKHVPERWKKQAEGATNALYESGRSPTFEKLSEEISRNVYMISDKITADIQKEIEAGLTQERQRLQAVQSQSTETLFQTRLQFGQDREMVEATDDRSAILPMQNIAPSWGEALHLATLNSAAASSMNSAKEMVYEGWQNLVKRVRGGEHIDQWTTHDRVAAFKTSYKERISSELALQVNERDLSGKIGQIIQAKFGTLKSSAAATLEDGVNKTEQGIADLRDQRIRDLTLSEQEIISFAAWESQLIEMNQRMNTYSVKLLAILEENITGSTTIGRSP